VIENANGAGAGERRILTVREINEEISAAMTRAFPSTVWVRGEVQRLPHDAARRQHVYFELHETGRSGAAEYAIPVSLMGWDRQKFGLGRFLDGTDPDLQIANQLEVCVECRVDFYAKFGKLTLKIVGVDRHFSLGRLEARRREILAWLAAHHLLEANAGVPLPELPLRVGLITAPGSAAERDFLTGLQASPWAFAVTARGARMQGEQTQAEVMAALEAHVAAGVDVVVITRGGGSRADLSWFDQQDLAAAIARCPAPVITAIGHEIDRSIADMVAHHACKTPTAAAEFLVDRVDAAARRLDEAADRLRGAALDLLDEAGARLEVGERLSRAVRSARLVGSMQVQRSAGRLQAAVGSRLETARSTLAALQSRAGTGALTGVSRARERLGGLGARLPEKAAARVTAARSELGSQTRRLGREALRPVPDRTRRLDNLAAQVRLLDPQRVLARGFTITLGADGQALKRAADAGAGDTITTRFTDGRVDSVVAAAADARDTVKQPMQPKGKGRRGGKKGEPGPDTGQETLFR
jgi:exodeoxyribonuclease VII large subunit